jgi:hypothetical protein
MCMRYVIYSCGHAWRETIEPLDVSLILDPISVPQGCWRCLGKSRPVQVSYYGDLRMELTGKLEAPSERRSRHGSPCNVTAPANSSITNTASADRLRSPFVRVLDTKDLPSGSLYANHMSARQPDADDDQISSPGFTSSTSSRLTNRSAQVIDGTLYSGHDNFSIPVPDFQSNIGGFTPVLSRVEAVVAKASLAINDGTAEVETEPQISIHERPFEGSEIWFPGLSTPPR